jgi:hypothetical protein
MLLVLTFAAAIVVLVALRQYFRARGTRVVHCPSTGDAVAVTLSGGQTLLDPQLRLHVRTCTYWPERRDCAQLCVREIEDSPVECLFAKILASWYKDARCAFCQRPISPVTPGSLSPGLLSPGGDILDWPQVEPERVFDVMATHRPLCASCLVAETFRRRFPDRVVDRPERPPRTAA